MTISQLCRLGLAAAVLTVSFAAHAQAKEAPKTSEARVAPSTSKTRTAEVVPVRKGLSATSAGVVTTNTGGTAVKTYKYEGAAVSDSGCGNCTTGTRDNCKPGDVGTTASPPSCQPGGTFCCYTISQ